MRLVFFGTPQAAVPSLEALAAAGHEVALAISQPDRPKTRSSTLVAPPVKVAAQALGIEVLQPVRLRREEFLDELRRRAPELLVVVAYGRILERRLLNLAPAGAINLHFSLLPRYRGAAPVQWALARGETTTGVTTMRIAEGLDEGDVLLQREIAIEPGERAPALQLRLAGIGSRLLVETIERHEAGTLEPRPQDGAQASHAPLLSPADGDVDLRWPAAAIEGRIRGFDPWPGVWVRKDGRRLRLVDARALSRSSPEPPGTLVDLAEKGLGLVCGGGTVLQLKRLQFEGRRALSVEEARNGRQIQGGDVLS